MTTTNAAPRLEIHMKPRVVAALFVAPLVVLAASGCSRTDPCARLAPPTPQELAVVAGGAEVERELDGGRVECDLVNGRWTRETS